MKKYHMPGLKPKRLKWWQLFALIGLIAGIHLMLTYMRNVLG